ncbi:hypothetical protein QBC35DRAFT_540437 [Podospora australis]|uniref:Uncharacterized protein n=1 Tax=Podospora australis TaxID=1536484 RepID=A0AAN7ADC2_9PEZI|nr:hypothetical protein QBC35DRAFT_540437 [Podospora australis]
MKLSIISTILTAFTGVAIASPVAAPDSAVPVIAPLVGAPLTGREAEANTPTPVQGSVLNKRGTGTLNVWMSASTLACIGTPGATWTNPANGCYHHTGSGTTPRLVQRMSWGGDVCTINVYDQPGCLAANLVSTAVTGALCWASGWTIYSWKITC